AACRSATSEQHRRVRDQPKNGVPGPFLPPTHIDDAGGRFSAVNAAKIVGQLPTIAASYPAASAAHQTELPPEPSLGFSIDEMPGLEPSMAIPSSSSVEATGDPADARRVMMVVQQLPPVARCPSAPGRLFPNKPETSDGRARAPRLGLGDVSQLVAWGQSPRGRGSAVARGAESAQPTTGRRSACNQSAR